jgi:hypothetical protein
VTFEEGKVIRNRKLELNKELGVQVSDTTMLKKESLLVAKKEKIAN